jgi:hypothetical protein
MYTGVETFMLVGKPVLGGKDDVVDGGCELDASCIEGRGRIGILSS